MRPEIGNRSRPDARRQHRQHVDQHPAEPKDRDRHAEQHARSSRTRRRNERCRTAAITPTGIPTTTATSIAPNVSSTVAGKYVASFCATGCVSAIEMPRSPCSTAPRYLTQLYPPRLIESEFVRERRDLLRARVLAEPDRDRIARDQVQEHKADERDRQQHEDEPQTAVDDEARSGARTKAARKPKRAACT